MSRLPVVSTSLNLEDLDERVRLEKRKQKMFSERIRSLLRDTTRYADRNTAMRKTLEFVGSSSDSKQDRGKRSAINEVFTEYEVKAKFQDIMESEVRKFKNPEISNRDLKLISKLAEEVKTGPPSKSKIKVGETVVHDTKGLAIVRYVGEAPSLGPGTWYGLELKEEKYVVSGKGGETWQGQGLGDGSLLDNGRWTYYFKCKPGNALFVRHEHIKGSKNATTVIASAHKMRTARVAVRVGFDSRDVGEIGTGNLDNTSVFYVVIPENCTFENFQHNVALILGVQSGVVVIEAWGHDDVAWKKKQQQKKNVMNKNGIDDDEEEEEEDIEKDIMMNIQNESLKIPTKLRFEPSDCVVNFLRSKMSAPSGAYAEWSDEKSVLPTLAVTLRRVEMSRAKFWLTHPHDLARVFEMISSSRNVQGEMGDEKEEKEQDDEEDADNIHSNIKNESIRRRGEGKNESAILDFEQFTFLMSMLRSASSSRMENVEKSNKKLKRDENNGPKINDRKQIREEFRRFRKISRDPKKVFEDYVLFKKYGSVIHIIHDDYDSDEFADEHQIEVEIDRQIRIEQNSASDEEEMDNLFQGGGNNGIIEKIEDEEVLELYLKQIKDPQERQRVAERLRSTQTKSGARREARRLRSRLGMSNYDMHPKRDREERNFGIDRHEFVNVLKIWSEKEKTFGVRLELVDFYSTIKMPLEDPLQFDNFLLGLRSIRTGINTSAARDLFRRMDYKKRGYVTYQQMNEFWEDICKNLIDADSKLLSSSNPHEMGRASEQQQNLDMPMFMRSEKEKSNKRVYAPLSAEKKHVARKICWIFVLLVLWIVAFGLNVVSVQDRYQFRRYFVENIIEKPFIDTVQSDIANMDVHIDFKDISSATQALNFIVQVIDPYYKMHGTFTPTISDPTTLDFLQKTDKNLNTVVASKLTIRQVRMEKNRNCASDTGVYANSRECVGPYVKDYRLTSFGGNLSNYPDTTLLDCLTPPNASVATICALADGWTFYEPSLNEASPRLPGVVANEYDFSGFRITFDLDTEYDFEVLAENINSYEWFDDQTSAIILHISLFNPSLSVFEDTWLLMEFSPYGVVYPSYYLDNAHATTLLDTTVQKVKIAVYIWGAIVHVFSMRRMYKRWKFVDIGLKFLDLSHLIAFFVAIVMYFAMYLNTYRATIMNDNDNLADLRTYLTSNEQTLLLLASSQNYVAGVELFMFGLIAFQAYYCVVLLSRRSAVGIVARSFWGSNLIDLLSYYAMFLLGVAMITIFVQPRLRTNVSEYQSSLEGFERIFAFMMSGLTTDELNYYREETGYVERQSRVSVTTILVLAIVFLRLFVLPLFRAIVAQNYMRERFATKYEETIKHEKHSLKQYFVALTDVFSSGNTSSNRNASRKVKLMRSALRDVETARDDYGDEESKESSSGDDRSKGVGMGSKKND